MGFPTEACFFYWVALCVDPQKRSTQTTTKLMLTLAREAMNTRFELVLPGDNIVALRAAGEEALDEIERLHAQLSFYSPSSEISHLNARAAREPVQVEPRLFKLLEQAQRLSAETGGLFDITIAPLLRCWDFTDGTGSMPDATAIQDALAKTGMHLVHLDSQKFTVQFAREGVQLDLGAIGKGYAVERAANLLREAGVSSAFLHGGTSTAFALGTPPDAECWKVALDYPESDWMTQRQTKTQAQITPLEPSGGRTSPAPLAVIPLKDEAVSVSAIWGKFFSAEGMAYGHILDPRTGYPASKAILSCVVLPSATETDALSTALLAAGLAGHDAIAGLRNEMRTLVVEYVRETGDNPFRIRSKGLVHEKS